MRLSVAALLALCILPAYGAQEGVRLKSGKYLSGTVIVDEADKDGFKLERWDTGGTVYVRWAQIPDAEKNRLLGRVPAVGPVGVFLEGVRAITETRDVVGLLKGQDATQYFIKTASGEKPIPVPKSALLKPLETLQIPEAEAFSAKEMIDSRLAKATDYAGFVEVARFAVAVKDYERAKTIYAQAGAADPSKKEEVDGLIAAADHLIKEGKAAALLAQVKEKADQTDYPAAIDLAKKLQTDFPQSEAAKQNAGLVATLEKEAKDYELKKADILAEKVPARYKAKRAAFFSEYARSKYKLSDARARVANIDKEVTDFLVKDMKATAEEIATAWGKREQKPVTVTYGSGSWIAKGGQDGGLDTDAKTQPKMPNQNQGNTINPFNNRNQQRNQQQQPKPLGKKLQTSEEWWQSASGSERKAFIEAEYASTSGAVNRTASVKNCRECNGGGTLKGVREGNECEIKCSRCHGVKEDVVLQYW